MLKAPLIQHGLAVPGLRYVSSEGIKGEDSANRVVFQLDASMLPKECFVLEVISHHQATQPGPGLFVHPASIFSQNPDIVFKPLFLCSVWKSFHLLELVQRNSWNNQITVHETIMCTYILFRTLSRHVKSIFPIHVSYILIFILLFSLLIWCFTGATFFCFLAWVGTPRRTWLSRIDRFGWVCHRLIFQTRICHRLSCETRISTTILRRLFDVFLQLVVTWRESVTPIDNNMATGPLLDVSGALFLLKLMQVIYMVNIPDWSKIDSELPEAC